MEQISSKLPQKPFKSSSNLPTNSTVQFSFNQSDPEGNLPKVFSLSDLNAEDSNHSDLQVSPVYKTSKFRSLRSSFSRGGESSTNYSNSISGKNYEEVKSSMGSSVTEFKICTFNSPESKKNALSLNSYSPCFVFCTHCNKHVNSEVEFLDDSETGYLAKIFKAFTMCCGRPEWFNRVRVHKCPLCTLPFF